MIDQELFIRNRQLTYLMRTLSTRELQVIDLRFVQDMTYARGGEEMGVSGMRFCQILQKSLRKLYFSTRQERSQCAPPRPRFVRKPLRELAENYPARRVHPKGVLEDTPTDTDIPDLLKVLCERHPQGVRDMLPKCGSCGQEL